jgi:hypothetical protein
MRLLETAVFAVSLLAAPAAWAQGHPAPPAPPAFPVGDPAAWSRYEGAREVQLRDVAAFVRVRPENRTDVAVGVIHRGPLPALEFRTSRNRLIIDGNLRRQIRSCHARGQSFEVQTARQGRLTGERLPIIELRVPMDAVVSAGGAVRLLMGPSDTARVRLEGCGDADIERVQGEADIAISGSPDLRIYDAGRATIAVAGAGDVVLGVARAGLTVSIAGSGDFVAARADGPTSIAIQGAGDVLVRDGRATTLSVAIAGAGDVTHNGSAERLDAAILGAGDVRVRRVDGEVTRRVLGGGEVVVGR